MPQTCENCAHWRANASNTSLRIADGTVGECKAGPPIGDYRWPRTYSHQSCHQHGSLQAPQVSFATAKVDPAKLTPEDVREIVAALKPTLDEIDANLARLRALPAPAGQATLFDEGTGSAPSSGEPERNGGPAAAVDAAAPQSTAATEPVTSPAPARAPSADGNARGVSLPRPRRNSKS